MNCIGALRETSKICNSPANFLVATKHHAAAMLDRAQFTQGADGEALASRPAESSPTQLRALAAACPLLEGEHSASADFSHMQRPQSTSKDVPVSKGLLLKTLKTGHFATEPSAQ